MLKVIIAGGRDFDDAKKLEEYAFSKLHDADHKTEGKGIEIVSGGAKGADKIGEGFAKAYKYDLTIMHANWDLYGKKAGPIRNRKMAMYADALIAFWDGKSKGTKNMIDTAKEFGLSVRVCKY